MATKKFMKKWKCKKSKVILKEGYFKVRKDRVELPDGKAADWVYLDKSNSPSAMVIGVTENKEIILDKQYRYLVDEEVMELPAGYSERGENIKETARREFEEETGYKCRKLIRLGSFWETYGELKHIVHFFVARIYYKTKQKNDPFEDIKVRLMKFDQAVDLVLRNKIPGAPSALAILLLNEKINRGEIKL